VKTSDEIIAEISTCTALIADWPSRRTAEESGLGRQTAERAFAECVAGLVMDQREAAPEQFGSGRDGWQTMFAYEPIERHARFFAGHRERRGEARARDRPYDQMGIAFPEASRLVAPLLLGRAIASGVAELSALEPVILIRKPRDANPRPHLHTGKPRCGGTLNALALVAHCVVANELRCLVVGTRPLSRHQDLQQSVPVALRALLADMDVAVLALRGPHGRTLALAPVVSDILVGGGPHGKGDHKAANTELVAARTMALLNMIYRRSVPEAIDRGWPMRVAALRVPTEPLTDAGPHRVAPNGLEPVGAGWSQDPHKFASEVAAAPAEATDEGTSPNVAAMIPTPGDHDWCSVPALLTGIGPSARVALFACRSHDGRRPTVWLTAGRAGEAHIAAVEANRRSRAYQAMPGGVLGTVYDYWVTRAYRRYAAGDLLLKGGAADDLVAGVAAAMTAAFLIFALERRP
jgi:hypothetical protein